MSRVCKVSPLFRNLIAAVIIFDDQSMSCTTRSKVAVESLGRNSPHLQNLTIYPRGNYDPLVASWPVIDAFKHVPLRCLNLLRVYFDPGTGTRGDAGDEESEEDQGEGKGGGGEENRDRGAGTQNRPTGPKWGHLLSAVPQLEEFYLERQQLLPEDLALFASHLPMLRLLVFGHLSLEAERPPFGDIDVGTATQPIILRAHSYFGFRQFPNKIIANAARCVVRPAGKMRELTTNRVIFGIWPNATCEARNTKPGSGEQTVGGLNKAIASLRI
ncbi:hypothetical protein FRC10_008059, partial [Ceratobasidium sp. 414]